MTATKVLQLPSSTQEPPREKEGRIGWSPTQEAARKGPARRNSENFYMEPGTSELPSPSGLHSPDKKPLLKKNTREKPKTRESWPRLSSNQYKTPEDNATCFSSLDFIKGDQQKNEYGELMQAKRLLDSQLLKLRRRQRKQSARQRKAHLRHNSGHSPSSLQPTSTQAMENKHEEEYGDKTEDSSGSSSEEVRLYENCFTSLRYYQEEEAFSEGPPVEAHDGNWVRDSGMEEWRKWLARPTTSTPSAYTPHSLLDTRRGIRQGLLLSSKAMMQEVQRALMNKGKRCSTLDWGEAIPAHYKQEMTELFELIIQGDPAPSSSDPTSTTYKEGGTRERTLLPEDVETTMNLLPQVLETTTSRKRLENIHFTIKKYIRKWRVATGTRVTTITSVDSPSVKT
jgi:hypothetical protein